MFLMIYIILSQTGKEQDILKLWFVLAIKKEQQVWRAKPWPTCFAKQILLYKHRLKVALEGITKAK